MLPSILACSPHHHDGRQAAEARPVSHGWQRCKGPQSDTWQGVQQPAGPRILHVSPPDRDVALLKTGRPTSLRWERKQREPKTQQYEGVCGDPCAGSRTPGHRRGCGCAQRSYRNLLLLARALPNATCYTTKYRVPYEENARGRDTSVEELRQSTTFGGEGGEQPPPNLRALR